MSDNLTIFGIDYTGVTGIKATGTGNGTLAYIRPTGTLSVTQNGTVDVTQYASASVSVSASSNDFVVTMTYDSTSQMYEPDKTLAEIDAAYVGGKSIVLQAFDEWGNNAPVSGSYSKFGSNMGTLYYSVNVPYAYELEMGYECHWCSLDTTGVHESSTSYYRDTSIATAVATDVAQGKTFFNASGYETGTASGGSAPTLQTKTATPTETAQTITPDSGYDGLSDVTVGAISSTYVGSGITRHSSTDLTASGATVYVPAGYYESVASKSVASGAAGTPTATKGSVSNHSISVTPSVTNTTGYITGGTKNGTAVSVAASELVSGTYTVSASGTHDVTNYASASVAAGGATASATKGTVSNHSVTVTPSVTRTAGYVTAGTSNGTAVTVSASELVSGSETKTANGTYDVTNLASLVVALDFVTYYTSSSNPTSSQGSNGDIWLVTS